MLKKCELLAPAGDLVRCKTAIRYGADAVYIGGQRFSLRSRASNFSLQDIRDACAFAHAHGARIHVTVNMIPHEEDLEGLEEYLRELQDAGVDAIIAASAAVMEIAARTAPELQIHCSTQMSVTNSSAAVFLRDALGADRVVLARECTMEDVRNITKNCGIETEAFIHGGMCVNYSGRCTLSNRMTLRDANRGGCAQSCRWRYHVYDGGEEICADTLMTMGSKDLCAASMICDLMEAGVSSLKIEGRMKTEYYVACVVSAYRRLIDHIYEKQAPLSEEEMRIHEEDIARSFNREVCTGFYNGEAGPDSLIYTDASDDVRHDFLAVVLSYDKDAHTALIETRNPFSRFEKAEVISMQKGNRSFVFDWIRDTEGMYIEDSRHPMKQLVVPVPFEVQKDAIIRRIR
ncbi:MAG: U32 family peptidase [Solobacterium sp.]|nr:U32 family peptidase [Solobacterium sp.]